MNREPMTAPLKLKICFDRELLCQLFHWPENVVFTKNITKSLNVLIKGLVGENDHVIVSSMSIMLSWEPKQP